MNLVLGIAICLLGVAMVAGGAWLLALGGSFYYLPAGIALIVSGVLIARRHRAGAWLYWAVLAVTAVWTAWESGLDYWRWIPRFGLFVGLGILVALFSPRLRGGPRWGNALTMAVLLFAVFLAAFGLAWAPHGVTHAAAVPASTAVVANTPVVPAGADPQPAQLQAGDDWPAYGGSNDATRYSSLKQIDRSNVSGLERAWTFHTGDRPEERWGAETTPLKVGDSLYLCTPHNVLIALDAKSGAERWRFDPKVSDDAIPYTAACRGVAYYVTPATPAVTAEASAAPQGDRADSTDSVASDAEPAALPDTSSVGASTAACATRIVSGTLDGRLIEVDAGTGKPCADFGNDGQVDITEHMGETPAGYVSINSAPVIVRGVIVTGHQVLDGQSRTEPSGVILGYDVVTGDLRWSWDMMHPEWEAEPPEGESFTRGTPNMWTTAAGDERLGYVYLPMGNSSADYWSGMRRPQENEFATSLVAIDVTTGQPVWHFQTTHKDVWDYDLGSQPTLVDWATSAGGTVPAIVLPSKQGDIYVLDRETGRPLTGVEERPAPQGGAEPDQRAPTQPHSLYHTLAKAELTERDMWGLTPLDQLYCRIQFRRADYRGMYTPPSADQANIEYPGYNGGSDWGSVAVDPARGVIIANYNDMPNYNQLVPRDVANAKGWVERKDQTSAAGHAEGAGDPQMGTPYAIDVNAGWQVPFTGMLCKEPPYGGIRAIDLASGKTLWDRPLGTARANGPFGIRSGLNFTIGTPNNGGSVVTAGGLIFIAAATDDLIRAIDIETGETVWQDELPAGGQANPMIYAVDGKEYLVIVAAGHHFMKTPVGDDVIAYALPN